MSKKDDNKPHGRLGTAVRVMRLVARYSLTRKGILPPGLERFADELDSLYELRGRGWYGYSELAELNDLPPSQLEKRLRDLRRKNPDLVGKAWMENSWPRPHEPRFLFCMSHDAVSKIIRSLRQKGGTEQPRKVE